MTTVYRLRAWPDLPPHWRTAPLLRTLSRMSIGPMTHERFLHHSRLQPPHADRVLELLVNDGFVTRTTLGGD